MTQIDSEPPLNRQVILHIGYHKTATSWLQTNVFPVLPGVTISEPTSTIVEEFVTVNPFLFDPHATRRRLLRGVAPDESLLISSERLSGHPDSAGFDSRVLADRLHQVFPDARVLVAIRRQPDMVLACYKEYVRTGGCESLRRFLRPPNGTHRTSPHFDLRYLEYHHLVDYYRTLFTPERVQVMAYELILQSAERYVARISDFFGSEAPEHVDRTTVNPSLSPVMLALKRRTNLVVSRDAINPNGLIDHRGLADRIARRYNRADLRLPHRVRRLGTQRMTALVEQACRERFVESNRLTMAMTGLPLDELGYDTG
jgi:hypothetical protein